MRAWVVPVLAGVLVLIAGRLWLRRRQAARELAGTKMATTDPELQRQVTELALAPSEWISHGG